jgi:hypothetical protein
MLLPHRLPKIFLLIKFKVHCLNINTSLNRLCVSISREDDHDTSMESSGVYLEKAQWHRWVLFNIDCLDLIGGENLVDGGAYEPGWAYA